MQYTGPPHVGTDRNSSDRYASTLTYGRA
eukprot:COSAG05_NODE_8580_length_691_cov_0.932432_1_plen_28_part_10